MEVTRNGKLIPFSVDTILTDMIESDISPLDAIDIIFQNRKYMKRGMPTSKLVNILNKAIAEKGYNQTVLLTGSFFDNMEIIYFDGTIRLFSYKTVKELVREFLKNFEYNTRTYRAIVDELHRIIRNMRTTKIKASTIERMMPAVLRNVTGINPFSKSRCVDDYQKAIKLNKLIKNNWKYIPDDERPVILQNYFLSIFRIILLSYEYLPGNTELNTIHEIGVFITDLSSKEDLIFSDKELHILGKTAKRIRGIINETDYVVVDDEFIEVIDLMIQISHGLMNRGAIQWIIVADRFGAELFSKFSSNLQKKSNRSLIAMAISGIQSIVNEITDNTIKKIESDEGNTIIFEQRKYFSVLFQVEFESHLVRQRMQELANFIESILLDEIKNFKGSVSHIYQILNQYVEKKFENYLE